MNQLDTAGTPRPTGSIVLGTMTFGDTASEQTALEICSSAFDAGITAIDTANGYAGGRSEEIIGRFIAPYRDRVELATKVGIPHPDAAGAAPLSRVAIRRCVDGSLHRLGTDRIDLLYLHQPDRSTPIAETLAAVGELIDEGTVGAYGVSNFSAWQIAVLSQTAVAQGLQRPSISQQVYSLVARRLEDEYVEYAEQSGLATMCYNPLAGGILTGIHRFGNLPDGGRFGDSRLADMYRGRYWNEATFDVVRRLATVADSAAMAMPEMCLRWAATHAQIDSVLVGSSTLAHFRANVDALRRGPLPPDLYRECTEISNTLRGPMPAYHR